MKRKSKFALFAFTTFLTLGSLYATVGRHHHRFHSGGPCGVERYHQAPDGGCNHHHDKNPNAGDKDPNAN